MIHLVLTRKGYEDLLTHLGKAPSPIWVNQGVLSERELSELRAAGVEASNFTTDVSASQSELDDALATIGEHHPGQPLWIEHRHES